MKTQELIMKETCLTKVWTDIGNDRQVFKYYDDRGFLIGLNFHQGVDTVELNWNKPDVELMRCYKLIVLKRFSKAKKFKEHKCITKAIDKWLYYQLEELDNDYENYCCETKWDQNEAITLIDFKNWIKSDSVVKTDKNTYTTQDTQWTKKYTKAELKEYYIGEYVRS